MALREASLIRVGFFQSAWSNLRETGCLFNVLENSWLDCD